MSASGQTQHLHLSQYAETDRPSYIDDYTDDMQRIDAGFNLAQSNALQALGKVAALSEMIPDPPVCVILSFGTGANPSQTGVVTQIYQRTQQDQVAETETHDIEVLKEGLYLVTLSTSVLPESAAGICAYSSAYGGKAGQAIVATYANVHTQYEEVSVGTAGATGVLSLPEYGAIYVETVDSEIRSATDSRAADTQYTAIMTIQRITKYLPQ